MTHIVGGFYEEFCLYPQWHRYLGSAGRAAAALSQLNPQITLHTFIHPDIQEHLDYYSDFYKIKSIAYPSTVKISFEYYHSLSAPVLYPHGLIAQHDRIKIQADVVISYGMLEAPNPLIEANYLIFDPQSENDPSMIFDNGSTFNHLAIILNVEEGQKYTRENEIESIAQKLFEKCDKLKVVILKDGPFGAHLFCNDEHHLIHSYQTDHVFKIGSGDIFVAVFGHMWANEQKNPLIAAQMASMATAHYCNTKMLPLTPDVFSKNSFLTISMNRNIFAKSRQIYLAGPFFTMSERWIIEEAKYQLEKFKAKVFSPLHDVGYGEPSYVTEADLEGLNQSDILYAVLDDYDPGTIFEIGYAVAKGIPIVIFIENKIPINMTLFEGSYCIIEHDFATSIYKTIWKAASI